MNCSTISYKPPTTSWNTFACRLSSDLTIAFDSNSYSYRMAGSLILLITYGIEVRSLDDPFLVRVEKTMDTLAVAGNPGAFLVDTLPIRAFYASGQKSD